MEANLNEISDGRLYELNDMVRVGCHDCAGCSDCCQGMGQSILLDPYDVAVLSENLEKSFDELLQQTIELHMEAGLILPNMRMKSEQEDCCVFLNKEGRCSIHAFRPGICRLFPLGRNYTPEHVNYFLLVHECPAQNKTKMKVSKWLDSAHLKWYQEYLVTWHNLTKDMREVIGNLDEEMAKQLTMAFLHVFYRRPYQTENFYEDFKKRVADMRAMIQG